MENSVATSQEVKEVPSPEAIEEAYKFLVGDEKEIAEDIQIGLKKTLKLASVFEVEAAISIFHVLASNLNPRASWLQCLGPMSHAVDEYKRKTLLAKTAA